MSTDSEPPLAVTPTSFRRGNVADDPDADLAAQVFVLDLQERMPGVQRLRDWTLAALDPQPGERAVDVGCGTGTEVRRLAHLVGTDGEAIGVEPHPACAPRPRRGQRPRESGRHSPTAMRCRCRSRTARSS